jgi:hypothetical protein
MLKRRDFIVLASGITLAGKFSAAQDLLPLKSARLETLLFNLPDDLAGSKAAELIDRFKGRLKSAGVAGFLFGRNMISTQFPTRFEWIFMVQAGDKPASPKLQQISGDLIARCSNFVRCDVVSPLPAGFMAAASVKVRHTVMFNFKSDAPADARERIIGAIRTMGKLPMVRFYLVEPAASANSEENKMQWQVVGDFDSVADYRAYSAAPEHLAIREDFTTHTSRVAFLDVEI